MIDIEWKKEIFKDKSWRVIVNRKLREFKELIHSERRYLDNVLRERAKEKSLDKIYWKDWQAERSKDRIDDYEKQLNRWEFYKASFKNPKLLDKVLNIELAKTVPIGTLLEARPTNKSYKTEMYCCPIHKEKTPSFAWYKQKNNAICFGCGWKGDVIDLYQAMYQTDFKTTINILTRQV